MPNETILEQIRTPLATALPTAVYTHPVDNFVYASVTSSGAAIYCAGYSGSQSNIQKFTLTTAGANVGQALLTGGLGAAKTLQSTAGSGFGKALMGLADTF